MLRRGRTRAANRRLLLALVAAEVATVLVAMAGGSIAGALWPVLANGTAVVVALVALRVVAPASLWRMHGAEHKAVAAYEAGLDLSDLDAVLGAPRVHDRCGTNVVFLMMGAGVALLWLPGMVQPPAFLLALAIAAEVVTLAAGRPGAPLSRLLLGGGRWLQRVLTTAEPSAAEQAVGCRALLAALEEHARLEVEAGATEVPRPAVAIAA